MSEELKKTEQAAVAPATEEKESVVKSAVKKLSRRQALMGALLGAGAAVAKTAEAAEASCACLAAPDCSTVCPNGGTPKGDGTQACECNAEAKEQLATVAYSGSYNDLTNRPYRAASLTDGGDAVNSTKWAGLTLRLNHNTSDTWIPVFCNNYLDYVLKSEIAALSSMPNIGAKTFGASATHSGRYSSFGMNASRDAYGRLTGVGFWGNNCNCDCCNCGDDSN